MTIPLFYYLSNSSKLFNPLSPLTWSNPLVRLLFFSTIENIDVGSPVSCECWTLWLHLYRGCKTPTSSMSVFDGKALVLEPWVLWNTPSLPLLTGPLWPGMIVSVMDQIKIHNHFPDLKPFNCMKTNYWC